MNYLTYEQADIDNADESLKNKPENPPINIGEDLNGPDRSAKEIKDHSAEEIKKVDVQNDVKHTFTPGF